MARIGDILVQPLGLEAVVIVDEVSMEEVVIPTELIGRVVDALLDYSMGALVEQGAIA